MEIIRQIRKLSAPYLVTLHRLVGGLNCGNNPANKEVVGQVLHQRIKFMSAQASCWLYSWYGMVRTVDMYAHTYTTPPHILHYLGSHALSKR